jgi:hypothetical protein
VAGTDVARVAAALAVRPGEGWSADLGGPEALTLTQVNELIVASLGARLKGENKMPLGMLRTMSTLMKPFNPVLARQMHMGAVLDTHPQVVDSSAVWAQYGRPLSLSAWLGHNLPRVSDGV